MSNLANNLQTTFGLTKDPAAYEIRAEQYEQKGKLAKAQKNREKAAKLRATGGVTSMNPLKDPVRYDQQAAKWEAKGNMVKAQKNREKAARLRGEIIQSQNAQALCSGAPLAYGSTAYTTYAAPGSTTIAVAPSSVETHVHPTIVQQTSVPQKIVEVQPVVHREVDQPQVHVIERHSYEKVASTGPSVITAQPIVQETIRPRVIEEVQPVVHRSVPAPFVEHVEQHVTEHITQPTVVTKDVINNAPVAPARGVAAGGLPATSTAPLNQQARRL